MVPRGAIRTIRPSAMATSARVIASGVTTVPLATRRSTRSVTDLATARIHAVAPDPTPLPRGRPPHLGRDEGIGDPAPPFPRPRRVDDASRVEATLVRMD